MAPTVTVRTTVVDANDNPVDGAKVGWAVSPSGATLSDTSSVTNASGEASVTLRSETAGNILFRPRSAVTRYARQTDLHQ